MVCEKFLLLHFKSGKISVIIFLGPLLMELHFLFMNVNSKTQVSWFDVLPKPSLFSIDKIASWPDGPNLTV